MLARTVRRLLAALLLVAGTICIHAQTTTWALGQSFCSPGGPIYCFNVPLNDGNPVNDSAAWFDVAPVANPISSRFIAFHNGPLQGTAYINSDSTYSVTYTTITYTTPDGRHWTNQNAPQSVSFTFSGTAVTGQSYVGSGTIVLGNWRYSDVCSGRGCGGYGWHYSEVGGSLTVQMK